MPPLILHRHVSFDMTLVKRPFTDCAWTHWDHAYPVNTQTLVYPIDIIVRSSKVRGRDGGGFGIEVHGFRCLFNCELAARSPMVAWMNREILTVDP